MVAWRQAHRFLQRDRQYNTGMGCQERRKRLDLPGSHVLGTGHSLVTRWYANCFWLLEGSAGMECCQRAYGYQLPLPRGLGQGRGMDTPCKAYRFSNG